MTDLHGRCIARLDEIQARVDAATPGPWVGASSTRQSKGYGVVGAMSNRGTGKAIAVFSGVENRQEDAQLCAHAPTDLAALVTALRAVLTLHSPSVRRGGDSQRLMPCAFCGVLRCPTVRAVATALAVSGD